MISRESTSAERSPEASPLRRSRRSNSSTSSQSASTSKTEFTYGEVIELTALRRGSSDWRVPAEARMGPPGSLRRATTNTSAGMRFHRTCTEQHDRPGRHEDRPHALRPLRRYRPRQPRRRRRPSRQGNGTASLTTSTKSCSTNRRSTTRWRSSAPPSPPTAASRSARSSKRCSTSSPASSRRTKCWRRSSPTSSHSTRQSSNAASIIPIKHFFKAYATDGWLRDAIDRRRFAMLANHPAFSRDDYRAVPDKYRELVPEYIKDYVSLNQFAA